MSGRTATKQHFYSTIRSFYAHNRVPLPIDKGFSIRGDKPPVLSELTVEELKKILWSCNPTYQAAFKNLNLSHGKPIDRHPLIYR